MSGTVYLRTQSNILEDVNFECHFFKNLRIKRIILVHDFVSSFLHQGLWKKKQQSHSMFKTLAFTFLPNGINYNPCNVMSEKSK
jgi:hypothetical protein